METLQPETAIPPIPATGDAVGPASVKPGGIGYRYMSPEFQERLLAFKSRYLSSRGGAAFADWKYRQGPVDSGDCAVIALAPDGSIIGHLGAVIFPSVPGSRLARLALGTEGIVDEDFRGGKYGVFRNMDALLGARLVEKGAEVMYATPIRSGYLVSRRLYGRVDGVACAYLSKVFTPALWAPRGPLRKALHRLLSSRRFPLPVLPDGWSWDRPDNLATEDVRLFCREFMDSLDYGVSRNADFLAWRYGGGDGFSYEPIRLSNRGKVVGMAMLRIDPERCEAAALMECMALDAAGYDYLLGICMHVASRRSPALRVFGVVGSPGFMAYKRHGFRPHVEILEEIGRALAWVPAKMREHLVAKAENHHPLDDYFTLHYYPDPKRAKDFVQGRWYVTLGEKSGF